MDIVKLILTSLLSISSLFVITKIMGHKQVAQLDFFDYVSGITIGSIAAELATELETPWKPLVALILYGVVSVLLNLLASKIQRTRKYINGTPTIVMEDGKLYRKNIKKWIFNTFGNYSLHAEYRHYVSYPYCDEDVLETENSERTPTVNMALIFEGKLAGVLFKSNGKSIAAPDCERCLNWGWDTFAMPLDEEIVKGQFTFTLRKKDEKGDVENEA